MKPLNETCLHCKTMFNLFALQNIGQKKNKCLKAVWLALYNWSFKSVKAATRPWLHSIAVVRSSSKATGPLCFSSPLAGCNQTTGPKPCTEAALNWIQGSYNQQAQH